jgi:hypothetical protein
MDGVVPPYFAYQIAPGIKDRDHLFRGERFEFGEPGIAALEQK